MKVLGDFCDQAFSQAELLPFPLLYVLTLEPMLYRLMDEKASPALCSNSFTSPLSAKVSVYTDITVFVSHHLDIKAVKKVVAEYEQIAEAKINFAGEHSIRTVFHTFMKWFTILLLSVIWWAPLNRYLVS